MTTKQVMCRKCGNCCRQGGPALHRQDLGLVRSGKIPIRNLITIRKGELVNNPLTEKIQPASVELVKIVGTGQHWDCCYYDQDLGCTIYEDRPQACSVLKCWDTEEIKYLVEKDTLSRFDILDKDNPLIAVIEEHEKICSCDDLGNIHSQYKLLSDQQKSEFCKRVRRDLSFRTRVVADFNLQLSDELFYFGRPLFQLLQQLGVRVSESFTGIHLHWE